MNAPAAKARQTDVLLEASEWFAVLHSGHVAVADRQRWNDWLGEPGSPQRQAWAQVERIGQRFGTIDDGAARSTLQRRAGTASGSRRHALRALSVIGSTGLLAWSGSQTGVWENWRADCATATGEIRELTLDDGTRLWLDTHSAVKVAFTDRLRRIVLLRGDILVTTAGALPGRAKDTRPLVVDGDHGRMRALGTRFSVRQRSLDTLLAVFDGAVEVSPAQGNASRIVSAGEQVVFTADGIGHSQTADLARQAWSQGLLVAADMPLATFIAELARYRPGHLACDDGVAGLRLTGVYPLRDTDQALAAVAQALPVRIRHRTRWWVTVEAA